MRAPGPLDYSGGSLRGPVILALAFAAAMPLSRAESRLLPPRLLPPKAVFADVDGMVHPITAEIVSSAIEMAKRDGASVLVLRLNTPGGLMDAMRDTIQLMQWPHPFPLSLMWLPAAAVRLPAGFFILESGDIRAAMAPGTNTGAAHPVAEGSEMDAVMKEKVENEAARCVHAQHLRQTRTQRHSRRDGGSAKQIFHRSRSP